jgi:hypothetical protein
LQTRVAMKEPVGVIDRQIFFSLAGAATAVAGASDVCAFTPMGVRISATATRYFIVRLLQFDRNYTIDLRMQERHWD